MTFVEEELAGRPDRVRRIFEWAGTSLEDARRTGRELRVTCPFHPDEHPSLDINVEDALFICRSCNAGGDVVNFYARRNRQTDAEAIADLRSKLGLNGGPPSVTATAPASALGRATSDPGRIVETYNYADESDAILFQVVRYEPKDFRQRRPDGKGGWTWNLDGVSRVLYHLPRLQAVPVEETVYVVEGEKDVHALEQIGLVATTNPGGAGKWRAEYAEVLRGRHVVVLPDNDEKGLDHARTVAAGIAGVAKDVRIVELSGLPEKGDVSDWIDLHDATGLEDLAELLASLVKAAPVFRPGAATSLVGTTGGKAKWPEPLPDAALYGLPGEVVRTIDPHTEADPAAVLAQFLVQFGSCVGRSPHFRVGADEHHTNLFVVLVGDTSRGRKGTSEGQVRRLFRDADPTWERDRVASGLSSGEGLIHHVRDAIEKEEPVKEKGRVIEYQRVRVDEGVSDKRLHVVEAEFASTIRVMHRDGNILSGTLRQAWDSGVLRVLSKNTAARATDAHISVTGHITGEELARIFDSTDASSGFANRFLWVCVKRSKELPDGGSLTDADLRLLAKEVERVLEDSRTRTEIRRNEQASQLWREVYGPLSRSRGGGLADKATSRAEAQAVRLSLLYALADCANEIREEHLRAALAFWKYCQESADCIFGDSTGDPNANAILGFLRDAPAHSLNFTEISRRFSGHRSSEQIAAAVRLLESARLVTYEKKPTGGKPEERVTLR